MTKGGKGQAKGCPTVSLTQMSRQMEEMQQMMGIGGSWGSYQQDKGKGKGKGKSSGKSTGKGDGKGKGISKAQDKKAFWPCPVEQCAKELNWGLQYWNHPGRDCCHLCEMPRAATPSVQQASREETQARVRADVAASVAAPSGKPVGAAAAAQPPTLSKTKQKKLRNAEKKKEHEQERLAAGEVVDSEDEMDEAEEPLPTEEQLKAALKLLSVPQPLKEGWTAAAVVDDDEAQEASQSLAALRQEHGACAKVIKMVEDGVSIAGVDVAVTKAKMNSLAKAILKASKELPTVAVNAAQMRLDKEVYLRERGEKLEFVARGAATAKENYCNAHAMHVRMVEHWTDRLAEVVEEEVQRQARYAERNVVHEQRHQQVLEEYDKRIAAADQVSAEAKKEIAKVAATVQPLTPQEEARKAEEEKEEKEKADAAADVKKQGEDALAAAKEAFQKLNVTVSTVCKEDLPVLDASAADAAALQVLAQMYFWAKASSMGESFLPFSFLEMGATVEVAILLVGKKVWKEMFKGHAITQDMVCPMQLRQIMFFQLMAYDSVLRADKSLAEQEAKAQQAWEIAEPRLKKLRMTLRAREEL